MKWFFYSVVTLLGVLINTAWITERNISFSFLFGMLLFNTACLLFFRLIFVCYSELPLEEKKNKAAVIFSFFVLAAAVPFIWWGIEVMISGNYFFEGSGRRSRLYAEIVNLAGNSIGFVGASLVHFAVGFFVLNTAYWLYRRGQA